MQNLKKLSLLVISVILFASCGDGIHSGDAEDFFDSVEPIGSEGLPEMFAGMQLPEGPYFKAGKYEGGTVILRFGTYEDPLKGTGIAISILDSLLGSKGFEPNVENTPYEQGDIQVDDLFGDVEATRYYVNFEAQKAVRIEISEDVIHEGNIDATMYTIEEAIIKPSDYPKWSLSIQGKVSNFLNQFDDHERLQELPNSCETCGLREVPKTYLVDTLKGKSSAYFDQNWVLVRELVKIDERAGYYIVQEVLDKSAAYMAVNGVTGQMDEFHTGHEKGLLYLVKSATGDIVAVKMYYAENSESVYGEPGEMNSMLAKDLREQVTQVLEQAKLTLSGISE